METFWRRKKGAQLIAEIPDGNWRGVRDSNPEVHPLSFGIYPDLPSRELLATPVFPDLGGAHLQHMQ